MSIVFPYGCGGVRMPKWLLAADNNVSARRDCQVERAEIRILYLPAASSLSGRFKCQDSVVAGSIRTDP